MNTLKYFFLIVFLLLLSSCATYEVQYANKEHKNVAPHTKKVIHSFYLIGDGGNSPLGSETITLQRLKKTLQQQSKNATVLFLGDNIYPAGMPKKSAKGREFAEHQLNIQTASVADFKGNTIFIPGNHDWYSNGLKGLKRQEKYVTNILGNNTFLPKNGCPIKKININKDITLLIVDSEWYLTKWNNHPTINDDCDIKTRNQFFDEFESQIKKSRGKTTIVALHHPLFTNGPHGGQFSLKQQLFPVGNSIPLPFVGTLLNLIRKTSGVSNTDLQNKRYIEYKNRMVTLAQENDKVVFVSGHEHTLQYIVQDNLPQIISGSGSKISATRNVGGGKFSLGAPGYARLDVFADGSSEVEFISTKNNQTVYKTQVLKPTNTSVLKQYPTSKKQHTLTSIYSDKEVEKSGFYNYVWGKRYRNVYATQIKAKNVYLDTLLGGLTPVRKGGGHQSKSLRLEDKQGREYVMRALRKNAIQYMQSVAFKNQHIEGQYEGSTSEKLLLDIFTGSHPYAPFVVETLAEAIGVFHTKPTLYYVPKQQALGSYNKEFGNELYMIEERAASGHGDKSNFGFSNKIISTNDLLKALRKNTNATVDEEAYIRARLFDMLLGDWDRHEDQWRWAAFKKGKKTIYKPVPRDRDQVFSIMADGVLLKYATKTIPAIEQMQSFGATINNIKTFNLAPYPLDMALATSATANTWLAQASYIQQHLTSAIIDEAFTHFPKEVQGETTANIRKKLTSRLHNLKDIAKEYAKHLGSFVIIKGTDKDDWFDIERASNGITHITGYRIQKDEKGEVFHQKTYDGKNTEEIWVYGLDDKDVFHVFGKGDNPIQIRLIGGQNNDTYTIKNGNSIAYFDFKSKKSSIQTSKGKKRLIDDYETNVYDYKKMKTSLNQIFPVIGFNPDDGIKTGLSNVYTSNGFERNPFSYQHRISAAYFFATDGYELNYSGEFARAISNWNLLVEAQYTSPNYAVNFFGFGSNSENLNATDELHFTKDYNRVKIRFLKAGASLIWRGELGGSFKVGASYEANKIENTLGRFINSTTQLPSNVFNTQRFVGAEAAYNFAHNDNNAFPTLGIQTNIRVGYKNNINNHNGFGYLISALGFNHKLDTEGTIVLATKLYNHLNFGSDYEFYQAASIGGTNGLRGYRNQRFTGKNSFYQNTDIRVNIHKVNTGLFPLHIGAYSGFDYGKVWQPGNGKDEWKTSIGGGLFFNAANLMSANISLFNSVDGNRFAFGIGFTF